MTAAEKGKTKDAGAVIPPRVDRKASAAAERARQPAHPSREQDTRAIAEGVDMSPWEGFKPEFDTTHLKAPMPRPQMDQRWIRASTFGKDDPTNLARMWGKGWRPRPIETIPVAFASPTEQHGKFPGALVIEGMVLCERPKSISAKFRQFNRERIDAVTAAITQELRGAAPNNPAFGPIQRGHADTRVLREVKAAPNESGEEGFEPI